MVSRAHRTPFGEWWWTVDRLTLGAIGALMLTGVVLSLAASPPVAGRLGLDPFFFVNRHILFLFPAISIMLAVSFLSPHQIRRLSFVVFAVSIIMVAATPFYGVEIKGARRWLVLFGLNIQPSEFLKPAFVILVAWLFGESAKRPDMPTNAVSLAMLLMVVALLVVQPDFGQTMLIVLVWSALFFMAGMRLVWMFGLAGVAGIGLLTAYFTVPHVARRIQRFLDPASGEGTVKRLLPESHTDFVFAVAAEEFGVALCLALVSLFAFIVIRALLRAMHNDDPFTRFAGAGLTMLFATQSAINMAVNLHLIPAKGMTLPFISYGGSSMLSLAYAMGMLLALTREQPRAAMLAPELATVGSTI